VKKDYGSDAEITFPTQFVFPINLNGLKSILNSSPNVTLSQGRVISFNHQLLLFSNTFEMYFLGSYSLCSNINIECLNSDLSTLMRRLEKYYSIVGYKKNEFDDVGDLSVGYVEFEEKIPRGTFFNNCENNIFHVLFRDCQKRCFKLRIFPSEDLVRFAFESTEYLIKIPRSKLPVPYLTRVK